MPCDQPRLSPGDAAGAGEEAEREEPRPRKRKAKGKAKAKAAAASSSSSSSAAAAAAPSPARGSESPMEGEKEQGARGPQVSPRGEEPLLFPAWEEGSGDENALVIHSQTEEEEAAAFKCLLCGESFGQQLGLLRHQKQHHAGERTFVCAECGKGFGLKHNLIIHQRIHTGEKPFGCGVCGKRFSLKQNLLTHQRVHGDGRPFSCPACGKSFREQRLLLTHQKRVCGAAVKEKQGPPACQQLHPQSRHRPGSVCGERLAPRPLRAKAPREKPHANGTCREGEEGRGGRSGSVSHPKTHPTEEGRRGLGQKEGPRSPKRRLRSEDAAFQCLTCGKNFAQKGKLAAHRQSHPGQEVQSPS